MAISKVSTTNTNTINKVTVTDADAISVITVGTQGLAGTEALLGITTTAETLGASDAGSTVIYDHSNTRWLATTSSNATSLVTKLASLTFTAGGASVTGVLDEDNLSSNSATKLATQQSIKAYVDAQVATVDTLPEVLANGNTTTTNQKIQFRDSGLYINSSADGHLDIVADTEVQIGATTIDINGATDISGNLAVGGNLTVTGTTISVANENIKLEDSIMTLNSGANSTSASLDGGFIVERGTDGDTAGLVKVDGNNVGIGWDESEGYFRFSTSSSTTEFGFVADVGCATNGSSDAPTNDDVGPIGSVHVNTSSDQVFIRVD